MKNYSITVVIPVKERFNLFYKALNSIEKQTYLPKNIIVIDDCSNNTLKINIKKYKKFKIKLIRNKKNKGVSASRNLGIKLSKTKYISFLDTDDLWLKKKLEIQFNLAEKNKLDFIYTNSSDNNKKSFIKENNKIVLNKLINLWSHPNCSCLFFKTIALKKIGKFDENLKGSEDHDLWFRIALSKISVGRINKNYVKIAKRNKFQISRNYKIRNSSIKIFLNKYKKIIPQKKYEIYKRELYARAFIPVLNDGILKFNILKVVFSLRYLIFSKIFYKRYFDYLFRNFLN
jgi:glycosyltransferase involved in cell wall biosynthesis